MIFKNNKYLISGILVLLLLLCVIFTLYVIDGLNNEFSETKSDTAYCIDTTLSRSSKLNDKNDLHFLYAKKNGLKKIISTNAEFDMQINSLVRNTVLVKVIDNPYYQVKSLTNSKPYLIPEAIDLLNDIGFQFQMQLQEKKLKNYRFRITSLLRTEEGQQNLGRRNSNATQYSAHLYGTTFDISYKDFCNVENDSIESSYEAVQTLTSVLIKMREDCKLLAVRERKQSCFHITVSGCRAVE